MEKRNVETSSIKKIAILGPESTGKTTLAKKLAEHFQTIWVPEFAREYVENLKNRPYYFADVEKIALEQQKRHLQHFTDAHTFVFYDTELIIIKIWFQEVFNEIPNWIEAAIKNTKFDLYLLCYPDLPWEYDPVRENPNRRFYLYDLYKNELEKINANYFVVNGLAEERLQKAIDAVKKIKEKQ